MSAEAVLREAIRTAGRVEGDLLMVEEFLNHRVDPEIVDAAGADLARRFPHPDLVLTAEASGIAPALSVAQHLGVPLVFAKKFLGPGERHAFTREVTSPTRGVEYRVEVARRLLSPGMRVVVVDDFLSRGRTALALAELAEEAGSTVDGLGFVIEKTWLGGRDRLEQRGWKVESIVRVHSLEGGTAAFEE